MDAARCMFCGHGHDRDLPPGLREQVAGEIEKLVALGVAEFWSGGMGTFDKMCESVVRTEKRKGKGVRLCLVIPYLSYITAATKELEHNYDEILYPDLGTLHYKAAIQKRNRYMVGECGYMLAYVKNSYGGAVQTLNYAKRHGEITIVNLADLRNF